MQNTNRKENQEAKKTYAHLFISIQHFPQVNEKIFLKLMSEIEANKRENEKNLIVCWSREKFIKVDFEESPLKNIVMKQQKKEGSFLHVIVAKCRFNFIKIQKKCRKIKNTTDALIKKYTYKNSTPFLKLGKITQIGNFNYENIVG